MLTQSTAAAYMQNAGGLSFLDIPQCHISASFDRIKNGKTCGLLVTFKSRAKLAYANYM